MFGVIAGIAAGAIGLAYHNYREDIKTATLCRAISKTNNGFDNISRSIAAVSEELSCHQQQIEEEARRFNENMEMMVHISTKDYEEYMIHQNAANYLEQISNSIRYCQENIVYSSYDKGKYHYNIQKRFFDSFYKDTIEDEYTLLLRTLLDCPSIMHSLLELQYIKKTIDNSFLLAPSFNSTRNPDNSGSFVELRGKEASNYFKQRFVILHHENVFQLIDKFQNKWNNEVVKREIGYLRDKPLTSPAKIVDDIPYLNVQSIVDCCFSQRLIGCLDGEKNSKIELDKFDDDFIETVRKGLIDW